MISKRDFINESLELNLFFLRIMKEHSIFLEASLPPKNKDLISQADTFKNEFATLLSKSISLSEGVIPSQVLESNEITTKYTLDAERATQFATGIVIDSSITSAENSLSPGFNDKSVSMVTDNVYMLNHNSLTATNMIIRFKTKLLNDVLNCAVFTTLYPSVIKHVLTEALIFAELLSRLQKGIGIDLRRDILTLEKFWDDRLSEHSFTIRGMLDPTEKKLFNIADHFGKEFETLKDEASTASKAASDLTSLTETTLNEAIKLRDFKARGTEGLLTCKVQSVILPLFADHVLREGNYYIKILKTFSAI